MTWWGPYVVGLVTGLGLGSMWGTFAAARMQCPICGQRLRPSKMTAHLVTHHGFEAPSGSLG